jgi:hypothetical protein
MMCATTTDGTDSPTPVQTARGRAVEVLLIVLVYFAAVGDPTPNVNEPHYLCRLKHFWNPSWCAGDLFLESSDTQVVFIWLFGWVTRWHSLAASAWLGRVISWTLLAWAWQRLSWRIVPRPLASVLSAALFVALNLNAHLAGEWVVGGVEAKCFAYVFVLVALRELIDRRWGLTCVLLGAAIAFHPLVGGWSALVCAAMWLLSGRHEQSFVSMLPGTVVGVLLSLLGVLPALSLTWHEPPELVAEAARIYVFDRLPHHLAPLTLPEAEIAKRFGGHAALVTVFVVLAQLFRWQSHSGTLNGKVPAPCPLSNGEGFEARRIVQFAWGALLLAVIGLAIEVALWKQPLLAAKLLRYYWFRLTDFAMSMAVSLLVTRLIAIGVQQRRAWAAWLLGGALAGTGVFIGWTAIERVRDPRPPADQKMVDHVLWAEACAWVAENTPPDAVFLTPKLNLSFKWRTGRPEVVNRKDIPQDARGIIEWHARVKDIYYTDNFGVPVSLDSIGYLGTKRVRELAKKYQADYVLMDRGQLLELPIVFRNEDYVVYRIDPTGPRDKR